MLFFAATTAAVVSGPSSPLSASPSPLASATPLREIGHVRSSAYCAVLAKHVAPALYGLIKTDELIAAGHVTFDKMGSDSVSGSNGHYDLDLERLSQVITLATRNLKSVGKLLDDPSAFPSHPQTDEERSAADLKAQLERVAAQQNATLNFMNGTHESALMGQMQEGLPVLQPAPSAKYMGGTPPPTPPPSSWTPDPSQYINNAGLPDRDINSQFSQKALTAGSTSGRTSYDSLAQVLQLQQTRIAAVEKAASASVVAAVALCNAASTPSPSPAPAAR